jgi:hypothetical protein
MASIKNSIEGEDFMNFLYTTVKPPFAVALALYIGIWIVCLVGLFFVWKGAQKRKLSTRWTTRDILYTAIIGVVMTVYNSLIADQLIGPLVQLIPVGGSILNFFDLKTWPYMFIFLVGVIVVRKPGIATALIFLKYVIAQLIFSPPLTPIPWPDYISQGLFIDLYLVARGEEVFSNPRIMIVDAFIIGFIKNMPRTQIDDFILGPFQSGTYTTILADIMNTVHDAISQAIQSAVLIGLVLQVAKPINMMTAGQKTKPMKEPAKVETDATPAITGNSEVGD